MPDKVPIVHYLRTQDTVAQYSSRMIQRWALLLRRFSPIQLTADVPRRKAQAHERGAKQDKDQRNMDKHTKFERKKAKAAAAAAATEAGQWSKERSKAVEEAKTVLPKFVEDTSAGEKKRIKPVDDPHYKAYNPIAVESAWSE
ncbi:valine--tRNA ligase [Neonectria punicea]|uniref:Valine--tRNA ligase n=1 Tax=Neonectria punicea TaxID=979145 RepID=A0ABR1GV53_9HYPO